MERLPDLEQIPRSKLRVESRRAYLKAMRPNVWGDSTTIVNKTEDAMETGILSDEELERRIAEIEFKQAAAARGDERRTNVPKSLF